MKLDDFIDDWAAARREMPPAEIESAGDERRAGNGARQSRWVPIAATLLFVLGVTRLFLLMVLLLSEA
ncbi:MAG: hypothetical protein KDB53_15545 [Planctomycetes bacterium]|nr:hypothetical protein [Planctomycetota bacterium]